MRRMALACCCSVSVLANAQDPAYTWVRQSGGTSYDATFDMAADAEGNTYCAQSYYQQTEVEGQVFTVPAFTSGTLLVKRDPEGALVWARTLGESGLLSVSDIAFDNEGHVLLACGFSGTITWDGTTFVPEGQSDMLLAELDTAGTPVWSVAVGSPSNEAALRICGDAQGNVFIGGIYTVVSPFDGFSFTGYGDQDAFIAKYNAQGLLLWAKGFGGQDDDGINGLNTDDAGNVHFTGKASWGLNYDGQFTDGAIILFIGRISADGDYAGLVTHVSGWAGAQTRTLVKDGAGMFYTAVITTPEFEFGGYQLDNPNAYSLGVLKYDADLNVQWVKNYGHSHTGYPTDIATNVAGDLYLIGAFIDSIVVGTHAYAAPGQTWSTYIAKLDSSGAGQWVEINTSSGPRSIAVDGTGCAYAQGEIFATEQFEGLELTSTGQTDVYVAKVCAEVAQAITRVEPDHVQVFPNPTNGRFTVQGLVPSSPTRVEVLDHTGRLIARIPAGSERALNVDMCAVPAGSYIVRVVNADGELFRRVLITHEQPD